MKDGVKLLVFSAGVFAVAYFSSLWIELPLYMLILLSFFFTGFSFIFNSQLQKAVKDENKNKFTHVFLGMTGIKMLSSLILLAFILALTTHDKLNSGVCIMAYYMFYTIFEVVN